jgi:hypothetical protein
MIIFVPAFHGMEDEVRTPIYLMIDDFEQVSRPINAQPQVFILVARPLHWPVVQIRPEGVQNVLPADMVFERGVVKLYDNFVHVSSILPLFFPVNAAMDLLPYQAVAGSVKAALSNSVPGAFAFPFPPLTTTLR